MIQYGNNASSTNSKTSGQLLGMGNFLDTTNIEGRFDFSEWVRGYGKYIDEQLEVYRELNFYPVSSLDPQNLIWDQHMEASATSVHLLNKAWRQQWTLSRMIFGQNIGGPKFRNQPISAHVMLQFETRSNTHPSLGHASCRRWSMWAKCPACAISLGSSFCGSCLSCSACSRG